MGLSQADLARLFFYSFLLGIGSGAFYDLFRITRVFFGVHYSRRMAKKLRSLSLPLLSRRKEHKESKLLGLVIFLQDFFFCVFCGIAVSLLCYEVNSGKFRLSAAFCVGGGFLLYRATVGRLVMLFSEAIAFVLEVTVRYLFFFLCFPWKRLFGKLQSVWKLGYGKLQFHRQKRMRRRYTAKQRSELETDAFGMLPNAFQNTEKTRLKKGYKYGNGKKETVQLVGFGQNSDRASGRGSHRHVCK